MRSSASTRALVALLLIAATVAGGVAIVNNGASPAAVRPPTFHYQGRPGYRGTAAAPIVGEVLSTTNGVWTDASCGVGGSSCSYTYSWSDATGSCGTTGTAQTYTIVSNDAGCTIQVRVTATNAAGSVSQTSAATGVVTGSGGPAPVNTIGPYFTASTGTTTACSAGCAIQGQSLSVSTGTWTIAGGGSPTSYTYQWETCTTTSAQPPTTASCSSLGSANGAQTASYTVQSADSGHSLVPLVTAYSGSTASSPTGLAGACNTGEMIGATGEQDAQYHAAPTSQPAGCSPISAVVGTSQTAEEFCTNAVTTCGYADPLNQTAGVPAGVTPSTTGACATYTSGGSISSGTVTINGCKITGGLSISGGNVTITNSDLGGWADPGGSNPPINISGGTVNVNYSTLHGLGPNQQGIQMFEYVHGSGVLTEDHNFTYNGSRIGHNTSTAAVGLTVTNSFCWLSAAATNDHYECTYTGPPSNTTIQNSVFLNWHTQTGATYTDDNTGSCCSTALDFENNLLGGGGYTLYGGYRTPNLINANADTIIGNRFSRMAWPAGGNTGVTAFVSPSSTQSANIWDDTGASTGTLG